MIDPYSIIVLTRAIYAVLLHYLGQCCRFLLRNPSVELAFFRVPTLPGKVREFGLYFSRSGKVFEFHRNRENPGILSPVKVHL
jgi:hypothetical protein